MDPGQHTFTSSSLGFERHFNFFFSALEKHRFLSQGILQWNQQQRHLPSSWRHCWNLQQIGGIRAGQLQDMSGFKWEFFNQLLWQTAVSFLQTLPFLQQAKGKKKPRQKGKTPVECHKPLSLFLWKKKNYIWHICVFSAVFCSLLHTDLLLLHHKSSLQGLPTVVWCKLLSCREE